ncbi:glycosyltransferase family 1 protein [Luteimonas sp. SJ-92]|uniref:Glycosyltransferase family 1 protein n=1 Tax=Luteimonas salinisoli TaxID=2752307 RepID=A0A853JCW9_9GAMM|nr:glycosyltransferase family 1 protein [Luteimonas salinisoli]NZA26594.1 glycosyltransferase family 1 protein [Luteimonas salinisoli]
MRYAIVTETWPPEVNGVALTVHDLTQGLQARGHAVDLVRPRQERGQQAGPGELLVAGAALPRYPGLRFGMPATGTVLRRWRAAPPQAVYIATEGPLGWSALRAARRLAIPVASGLHTRFDAYMRDYGLAPLEPLAMAWMRRFHNRADATLVPTAELAGFLSGRGFRNVVQLARAVDTTLFDPRRRDPSLRAHWGLAADDLAAIHVGRIAAEKNLALAVSAFRRLQQRQPRARFVWVGDGPERQALARDNPDFVFCGVQRGEALARHFASGDLFLFPSRSETFGNVTLEAMASGVPVVAFDYGAARTHLRDGVHGAAVDDDDAFEAAVLRLGDDRAARHAMGAAARQAVLRLSPEQVAADFDALLSGLAARGARDATASAA